MSTMPKQVPKEQSLAQAYDLAPDQPGLESPEAEQVPKEQSEAKAKDVAPDQPGSESPEAEGEEEEEEGECGFCIFMKGGGCKDAFIGWEKCIQEAENNNEDLVEKCAQITTTLKLCMDAHADYYEPILRAEKLAEEQAIIELEKEKEEQAIIELEKETQNSEPNPSHSNPDQK